MFSCIIVIILKTKTYISIVLMLIFLAKFGAIDANGLNFLFSGNPISFVKPNCKKKNAPKLAKETSDLSQNNTSLVQVIGLNGYCASQFDFQLFSWKISYPEPFTVFKDYFPSKLNFRYLEHISPPPRFV